MFAKFPGDSNRVLKRLRQTLDAEALQPTFMIFSSGAKLSLLLGRRSAPAMGKGDITTSVAHYNKFCLSFREVDEIFFEFIELFLELFCES